MNKPKVFVQHDKAIPVEPKWSPTEMIDHHLEEVERLSLKKFSKSSQRRERQDPYTGTIYCSCGAEIARYVTVGPDYMTGPCPEVNYRWVKDRFCSQCGRIAST